MIVKLHRTGKGIGEGPVEYLIGKDSKRHLSKVLRGDPQDTIELINSCNYAQRYKSGVLSFAKGDDLTEQQKQELMSSFEEALLPGLEVDQYSCFWVEHRDKGRLELNFVIPALELKSGKRLQAYYAPADHRRIKAWAEIKRIELDLVDPNEPSRKQLLNIASNLPKERKKIPEAITKGLLALIEQGEIKNREDVVARLTEFGFSVVRETKSSISIADLEGGQNIRLKGWIYERDARFSAKIREEIETRSADYQSNSGERLKQARAEFAESVEIKRTELIKRYGRKRATPAKEIKSEQSSYVSNDTQQVDDRNISRIDYNVSSNVVDVVFNSKAGKLPGRNSEVKEGYSPESRDTGFTGSETQRVKRCSYRTQRGQYEHLDRSSIYIKKSNDDREWDTQRENGSFFEKRANQRREKIDERDRTAAIEKFTEDRNQSTRIFEQVFRRFYARIQGIKQQVILWFEEFKRTTTGRNTSAPTIISRSKELRQQSKLIEQYNERIKYSNQQFSKFNGELKSINSTIKFQLRAGIPTVSTTNESIKRVIGKVQQQLERERQKREKEQQERLKQQQDFTSRVIKRFSSKAFNLANRSYGYRVHHIYGEGEHLQAMPSELKRILYEFNASDEQQQQDFLNRLKNNLTDVKTLNSLLNQAEENYKKISRSVGMSR